MNSIGIWMGTGWYSPRLPGVQHFSPVIRAQLDISKETKQRIVTNTSWETKPSARSLIGAWRLSMAHKGFSTYNQRGEFISAGEDEEQFKNVFNYHGYRYALIEGISYMPNQEEDGFVPFVAPTPHNTGGGPAWGAMSIVVPWKTYLFYNDTSQLVTGYPYMKKYIEYLGAHCEAGVLQDIFPGEKWSNLGDWVPPDKLKEKVFEKYVQTMLVEDDGHLNTGMVGTQITFDYLLENNRNDLIDIMVNQKTYPGWGYMVEKGATTCWEQWNGFYSQIHSCFPYIGGWFYRGLGGIQWDPENPGFKNIILRPANSTATIYIPGKEVKIDGVEVNKSKDITFLGYEDSYSVFKIGSGDYFFNSER